MIMMCLFFMPLSALHHYDIITDHAPRCAAMLSLPLKTYWQTLKKKETWARVCLVDKALATQA